MSLAGEGMLVRLRRTSIALLGAVAAVGFALIVFISQLGFPAVFNDPIPANPSEAGAVHDAIALTQQTGARSSLTPHDGARPGAIGAGPGGVGHSRRASHPGGGAGDGPGVGGSHGLTSSPAAQPNPVAQEPQSVPVPGSTGQPVTPPSPASAPASQSTPAGAAPASNSLGEAKQTSDAKAKPKSSDSPSSSKVTSDGGAKSDSPSSGNSKGHRASKAEADSVPSTKPSSSDSNKVAEDQGAASPSPVVPPVAEGTAKDDPEAAGYASAKEAADSGKSGTPHH